MDLTPTLESVIFLITLITFVVAIVTYFVFRMKERKKVQTMSSKPQNIPSHRTSLSVPVQPERQDLQKPPEDEKQQSEVVHKILEKQEPLLYRVNAEELEIESQPVATVEPISELPPITTQLSSAQAAFLLSFTGEKTPVRESTNEENGTEHEKKFHPKRFILPNSVHTQLPKANNDADASSLLNWK